LKAPCHYKNFTKVVDEATWIHFFSFTTNFLKITPWGIERGSGKKGGGFDGD
jgi:hypothetical protein